MKLQLTSPANDRNTVYRDAPATVTARQKTKPVAVQFDGRNLTSDAANMLPLDQLERVLTVILRIREACGR